MGKGYAGVRTFLTIMNLPLPMTKKNYSRIARTVCKAVKTVAESCMSDAASAKEIKAIKMLLVILLFLIPQSLMMVPGRGEVLLQ